VSTAPWSSTTRKNLVGSDEVGVPPAGLVGGHLGAERSVKRPPKLQRVGAAVAGAQQVVDDLQAGEGVIGVVLLGPCQHLVDVVDDPDFLIELVGQRKLVLPVELSALVVHRADKPAVLREPERQQVGHQPAQHIGFTMAEDQRNLARVGEEAPPRPTLVAVDC